VLSEALKLAKQMADHRICNDDVAAQRLLHRLHSACLVNSGPDDRKIQSLVRADVSEENFSLVNCYAGLKRMPTVIDRQQTIPPSIDLLKPCNSLPRRGDKGDVWFARKYEIARYVLANRAATPVVDRGSPTVTGLPGPTSRV
jgi:hypothetical protein